MSTPNATILLVEDDRMTAEIMAEALQKSGYAVITARTFAEAMRVMRGERVDLAVLDIGLSGSSDDGVAIARELPHHQETPVLFVTGLTDPDTLARVKSTQASAFLSKPFQPVDLTMQVELLLQSGRKRNPSSDLLPGCIMLPEQGNYVPVRLTDVVFAQANGNYTLVQVVTRRNPYVVTNNLKNVEDQLTPSTFYKLSRSLVVNLAYLIELTGNQLRLRLTEDGQSQRAFTIPVERRAELLRRLPLVKAR